MGGSVALALGRIRKEICNERKNIMCTSIIHNGKKTIVGFNMDATFWRKCKRRFCCHAHLSSI